MQASCTRQSKSTTRRMPGAAVVLLVFAVVAGCGDDSGHSSTSRTAAQMEQLRSNPAHLTEFLRRMPKGADLHSHLTGAAQTESLIDWGIEDDLCVDQATLTSSNLPCGENMVPMRDAERDPDLYMAILAAWSMEGFVGPVLARHAHFFETFPKFGAAASMHTADIFVEQKRKAASERSGYLEIMSSFGSSQVIAVGNDYLPPGDTWTPEYLLAHREGMLADPRFAAALDSTESFLAMTFQATDQKLGCGTPAAEPACAVELRLQVNGNRTLPRAGVFAQFLYAFELAQRDPRIVGVNLVGAEEDMNSLAFYDDDMLAAGTLRQLYASGGGRRPVRLSLHAGELVPELLPDTPDGQQHLTFHIRHAVEIGNVDRIGHGVALEHERASADQTPETLLATMRRRQVMVEVCLTSNNVLLGVSGLAHPLRAYLEHGVAVTLSTDDEGVLRTDLTEQYVRAVLDQDLDYFLLKQLSRNALEYSFAPGASLWSDPGLYRRPVAPCARQPIGSPTPTAECVRYLADNRRAALQWSLEGELTTFERSAAAPSAVSAPPQ